jgi:hypothetical protein
VVAELAYGGEETQLRLRDARACEFVCRALDRSVVVGL